MFLCVSYLASTLLTCPRLSITIGFKVPGNMLKSKVRRKARSFAPVYTGISFRVQTRSNYKSFRAFESIDKEANQATLHRWRKKYCVQGDIQSWNLPIQNRLFLRVYSVYNKSCGSWMSCGTRKHTAIVIIVAAILPAWHQEKCVIRADTVLPPVGKKPRCWQSAVTFTLRGRHVANAPNTSQNIPLRCHICLSISLHLCCSLSHGRKSLEKHRLGRFGIAKLWNAYAMAKPQDLTPIFSTIGASAS